MQPKRASPIHEILWQLNPVMLLYSHTESVQFRLQHNSHLHPHTYHDFPTYYLAYIIFPCAFFMFPPSYPSCFIYHQISRWRMKNMIPFFKYDLKLFTHLILFHKYLNPFFLFTNTCIIFSFLTATNSGLLFVFVTYPISKAASWLSFFSQLIDVITVIIVQEIR
jgi:hypothetical protein